MTSSQTQQPSTVAWRASLAIALVTVCAFALSACDLPGIPGLMDGDDDGQAQTGSADATPTPAGPSIEDPIDFEDQSTGQGVHQVPDEAFQINDDAANGQAALNRIVEAGVQEPRTLNPVLVGDPLSEELSQLVFSGLMHIDPERGEPAPDLAESWDTNEEETVYTFQIRDDAIWHDGQAFSAHDAEFTFDLMMDHRTQSPRYSRIVERVTGVEAIDSRTVEFRLAAPYAPFLSTLASFGIVPQHLLSNVLPDELVAEPFGISNAIGTGPFEFNRWERAERIIFDASRDHHQINPAFDQYEYRIAPDEAEILEGLENGSIDWARISPDVYPDVEAMDDVQTRSFTSYEMISVALQLDSGITTTFENADIRRALLLAIDRETLVDQIWNGHADVAHSTIPAVSWAARDPETRYDYAPQRADELLNEAGWTLNDDGVRVRDGVPLEFTIIANGENPVRRALTEFLAAQWREIGIDVRPEFETWGSVRDRITTTRDFEALVFGYRWDVDPDQHAMWSSDSIPDAFNLGGYINRDVDRLLSEALLASDQTTRTELYGEVQELVLQDLPVLPLAFPNQLVAMGPRLHAEEQTAILIRNRANVAEWIPENDQAEVDTEAEN